MLKCKIQWVDKNGQPTPDDNPAVKLVRCRARVEQHHGRAISFPASDWFPICAEHAKHLDDPGMDLWECTDLRPYGPSYFVEQWGPDSFSVIGPNDDPGPCYQGAHLTVCRTDGRDDACMVARALNALNG